VSLARQLGKTLAELANPAQTPQQRFFKPGVHVPLAQLTLSTPAQATLNTLARYFETTPDEVLVANQDVAGLFQAHQEITAPGHDPYTVQPNDTPALVARAIWGDASDPSLASLSQAIAIQAGLIAGNIPVGILRLTPDATLSSAKVPLNDGTSFLTFLFTTKAPASESRVFLDLDYRINEMEYDLGSLPGIAGYQASSWLSFVLPIEATDARYGAPLGQVEIPVPLRSYPTPPSLIAQQVEQTPPRQLAEVKQWQYSYTYEHLDAAQDTIETGVRYNLPPKNGPARALAAGAPPARNLFEALANFTQVYLELEPDLRGLTAQQPPPAASAAVVAFQTLVTEVATAWRAWLDAVQPAGATTADYTFDIAQTTPDEHGIVSVTVTATGGTAPDVGLLPVIQLPGYTPVTVARVAATATANAAAEYQFQLPADPAQLPPIPQATVLMPAFDVLLRQNAWGAVWLTRNRNLSPSAVTNPAFVYQTPAIGFTNNAVPLLIDNTEWAIGEVAVSGGTLDQAGLQGLLQTIFDQILPSAAPAPHIVRLSCSYAFSLSQNSQGDDLRATVPVILVPQVALAAQSPQLQTVIDNVATAIVSWHQQHQPSTASGCYMFSLGVFSNLGAGDQNNLQPPLLQVNELTIALIPGA
jgi:hypothetical protein